MSERFALLADVHADAEQLDAVLGDIHRVGVDAVIVAGDYLDCLISKTALRTATPRLLEEIVAIDLPLWSRLREFTLVRGNQEERIRSLMAARTGPVADPAVRTALGPLVDAPVRLDLGSFTVMHGHTFDWLRPEGRWIPLVGGSFPDRGIVVFGHSHVPLLTTISQSQQSTAGLPPGYHVDEVVPGKPVPLPESGRLLINLAPVRHTPTWTMFDAGRQTITFRDASRSAAR